MYKETVFAAFLLSAWHEVPRVSTAVYDLEENIVVDVCAVQCHSLCQDIESRACEAICGLPGHKQEVHASAQWNFQCLRRSLEWALDCIGTCSTIPAGSGYVPVKPEVRVDRGAGKITLSWDRDPHARAHTLYLVAKRRTHSSTWTVLGWVKGEHYQVADDDLCSSPSFKVAAVSRYGSRWFSRIATAPAIHPGAPRNGTLIQLEYNPSFDNSSIYFTIEWLSPQGWPSQDIHDYPTYTDPLCRSSDPIYVRYTIIYSREIDNSIKVTGMKGQIPVRAVGCNIIFYIHAVSRCNRYLQGPAMKLNVDLSCKHFPNLEVCKAPPTIYPGLVENVLLTLVPYNKDMLGLVSWDEPTSLGSAGTIERYHLYWGIVDLKDVNVFYMFKTVLGHKTVSGYLHSDDIQIDITNLSDTETVGVKVLAAGPGQQMDSTNGLIILAANLKIPDSRLSTGMGFLHYPVQKDGSWEDSWPPHLSSNPQIVRVSNYEVL